jgi:hypothetical protein
MWVWNNNNKKTQLRSPVGMLEKERTVNILTAAVVPRNIDVGGYSLIHLNMPQTTRSK